MRFLVRCPRCGKQHFLQPEQCSCGHDFTKFGETLPDWFPCPRCGGKVKLGERVCSACNLPVSVVQRYECPKCGKPVDADARFCECGTELAFETIRCPFCGKTIRASSTVCSECGKNLYFNEEPAFRNRWVCQRCGAELPYETSPCLSCGDGA